MKVTPIANIIPANTVMNANLNSSPIQLYQMFGYCIQVVYTGTPTGTLKLQASADQAYSTTPGVPGVPVNWTDIANSSQAVSAAGNFMWNVSDVMYNWVRVSYTDASGGTSTAIFTVAQFNGKGI